MTCEVLIDPGRLPEIVLPDALVDPDARLMAWARPSDLLYQDCRFSVGPAIPDPIGPPVTTVPYEIILRSNGTITPTGKSTVDAIGMATYMIRALNIKEDIRGIGVKRLKLRPVLCGCLTYACSCNSTFDTVSLPNNTCEVTLVTVDGLPLLPAPPETITAVSNPLLTGVGTQTLGVLATPTGFVATYTTIDSIGVTHVRPFRAMIANVVTPFLNPAGVTWDGLTPQSIPLPARPRWNLVREPNGEVKLARINPFETCASTCPCASSIPTGSESHWPRNQRRDLPDWEGCTFAIHLTVGHPVPSACRRAVAALAVRIAKEMANEECAPTGMREGMNWGEIKRMVLEGSKTFGLTEVADWLNVAPRSKRSGSLNIPTIGQLNRR